MSAREGASRAARPAALLAPCACALLALAPGTGHAREPLSPAPSALEACGTGSAPLEVVLLPPPAPFPAARADARPDEATSAARAREVHAALRAAICDWFRDDRWHVSFTERETRPEPSLARDLRLSLEPTSPASVRIFADTARGRWLHDVPLQTGLDDAGIEAVAEALHSTAQAASAEFTPRPRPPRAAALATASAIAAQPAATAAPAAEPSTLGEPAPASAPGDTAAAPRARVHGRHFPVHTALGYQVYARGAEPFMHGPALHVELDALERPVVLAAWFRAASFMSGTQRSSGFAVRSSGATLSLGAAASVPIGGISARAGVGGGVDLVALDVRVLEPALVRSLPDRRVAPRPFSGLEAGVRWRTGPFEIAGDALVRLLWLDTRYQVRDGERTLTAFRPWQLQPGAALELGYVW